MLAAMRDRDVSVALGEGLIVQPEIDVADHAPALDLMVELGAPRINTISLDPDQTRTVDQISQLVEMAWERGMTTTVETSPGFLPGTLAEALEVIDAVGHPALGLLVDTMHIVRGGALPADVAAAADRIRYVQLSDAPMASRSDLSYFEEAMFERMAPGDGELPLRELLAVVPEGTVVSLEVPLRSEAAAGRGPHERLGRCVEATRALLDA
jgi:sugar phosphate isomerase/epimerase